MADVVFVAIVIAFFALAVMLVRACDLIIGPDTLVATTTESEAVDEQVAA